MLVSLSATSTAGSRTAQLLFLAKQTNWFSKTRLENFRFYFLGRL
jgi:hypothetical protein